MLTMLSGKRYGKEIIEVVCYHSDAEVDINFGSLYPALHKLTRRGLIQETEPPCFEANLNERGEHRRIYYMLTELGHVALGKIYKIRTSLRNMKGQWPA